MAGSFSERVPVIPAEEETVENSVGMGNENVYGSTIQEISTYSNMMWENESVFPCEQPGSSLQNEESIESCLTNTNVDIFPNNWLSSDVNVYFDSPWVSEQSFESNMVIGEHSYCSSVVESPQVIGSAVVVVDQASAPLIGVDQLSGVDNHDDIPIDLSVVRSDLDIGVLGQMVLDDVDLDNYNVEREEEFDLVSDWVEEKARHLFE